MFGLTTLFGVTLLAGSWEKTEKNKKAMRSLVNIVPLFDSRAEAVMKRERNQPRFVIDVKRTQEYCSANVKMYLMNKSDFLGVQRLLGHAMTLNLCDEHSSIIVGGTNSGQMSYEVLKMCPDVSFFGFEIQELFLKRAKAKLSEFKHVKLYKMGWSETVQKDIQVAGSGEKAGLYEGNDRFRPSGNTVHTVPLADFVIEENIASTLYTIVDTEGHEPKVIRGMRLDQVDNQRRFPLFQFELGGTWAARDTRHMNDPWNQEMTVQALESYGYLLFLIGDHDWLAVTSLFFREADNPLMHDSGDGPFLQGNLLAMHQDFTLPALRDLILQDAHFEVKLPDVQ